MLTNKLFNNCSNRVASDRAALRVSVIATETGGYTFSTVQP